MNPDDTVTAVQIMFDNLHRKATKIVVDKYAHEVDAEFGNLLTETSYRVGFVRLFAESHKDKPFPKINCIKLVRYTFHLTLKDAKELVDYAIEVIPEFKQEGTVKVGDYLRFVPKTP